MPKRKPNRKPRGRPSRRDGRRGPQPPRPRQRPKGGGKALLALLALSLASCACPPSHVDAAAVEPLLAPVLARHDAWLGEREAAGQVSALEARTWRRSSSQLRRLFVEAAAPID